MSFPKLTNSRKDTQLTNILQAYTNQDYIAGQILPTVPNLSEESGYIAAIGNEHLRVFDSKRAVWDETGHRMEFKITNDDTYKIDYYDLEAYIPDRLQDQAQKPFNMKRDAAISLKQAMMLEREVALATAMTSTTILSNNTTLSGTSQWTDYVNSTPESDIETARDTVQAAIGREANSIYLSRKVFNTLKRHPFFLNLVTGVKVLSPSILVGILKDFFELKNVVIGSAIKVSSNEGATETKASVWGNDAVLFYKPDGPTLWEPSFGYHFTLSGKNMRVTERRHTSDTGDLTKVEWAWQDKILDADAAYLIKAATA